MVDVESIKAKIGRMGLTYRPGNASKPGHLYNPLPFPEFQDVPYQRRAVDSRFELIVNRLPEPFRTGRVLDIGCHTGYNCFLFSLLGYQCTGVEIDPLTSEIARDVNELKNTGISFINQALSSDLINRLDRFDITLFLSTFQWVVLAEGFEAAVALLGEVQARCDVMFFETSMGNEGKMKLPQLPDGEAVRAMLKKSAHHSHVDFLGVVSSPDEVTPRLLFRSHCPQVASMPELNAMDVETIQRLERVAEHRTPNYGKENKEFISKIYRGMSDDQTVALKFVTAKSKKNARLLYREHEFLAALADVKHVPRLFGHGIRDGTYVLVSGWADGPTLADALENPNDFDSVSLSGVAAGLEELADSLRSAGIHHRDLRARNIILSPDGPVLIDFGWSCWDREVGCPPHDLAYPDDAVAMSGILETLAARG